VSGLAKSAPKKKQVGEAYLDNKIITFRAPTYDVVHGVVLEDPVEDFLVRF